jgi:hypothetical protein
MDVATRNGQMQWRAAVRVPHVRIGTVVQQTGDHRSVGDRYGKVQWRLLVRRARAPVGTAIEKLVRQILQVVRRCCARRSCEHVRDHASTADRSAAHEQFLQRDTRCGQTLKQCLGQRNARRADRCDVETMVEQPSPCQLVLGVDQFDVKISECSLRPLTQHTDELRSDVPMAESQGIEEMIGVPGLSGRQSAIEIAGQRIGRVEQGYDVPAASGGGVVQRTLAIRACDRAIRTECQQRANRVLACMPRLAGHHQCGASARVDAVRIHLALA